MNKPTGATLENRPTYTDPTATDHLCECGGVSEGVSCDPRCDASGVEIGPGYPNPAHTDSIFLAEIEDY